MKSNELHTKYLPTYSDFKPVNKTSVVGYKLARLSHGNHYSVVTGLFRYKERNIITNSYSVLYEREKQHFNEHLKDRLSIHKTKEDAITTLLPIAKTIDLHGQNLALLEITMSGDNIEEALLSNDFVKDVPVYVAPIIDKVKQIDVIRVEKDLVK